MIILENIYLALQSLKANPLRSILTLIGIAVGIAAVLYVVVLGEITTIFGIELRPVPFKKCLKFGKKDPLKFAMDCLQKQYE